MMLRRITGTALLVLSAFVLATPLAVAQSEDEVFRPLFNGRDLSGWVPVTTAPSTWTVQEGMLVCSGKPYGELRTDRMYQNFILELEWRHMVPRGNAGIFIWADDITARGVPFHRGIEVQILENAYGNSQSHTTHGDIFPIHGARMTPINGRRGSRAFPTEERSRPSPEWNHYRIQCQDGAIALAVNGKVVTQGRDSSPRKGYICLESEGGIVHYRNIRVRELPDTPISDEDIAIADRGYRCLYTGLELDGWKAAPEVLSSWRADDWRLAYEGERSGMDPSLSTAESFGDFGFIVDLRLGDTSQATRVLPRGADAAAIVLDTADPLWGPHLARRRQWNRIEGSVRGDRLTVILNGQEVVRDKAITGLPPRGPLTLAPGGPVEFANIFVRSLP